MVVYCDVCIIKCSNWESSTMNFNAEREYKGVQRVWPMNEKGKVFNAGSLGLWKRCCVVLHCISTNRSQEEVREKEMSL